MDTKLISLTGSPAKFAVTKVASAPAAEKANKTQDGAPVRAEPGQEDVDLLSVVNRKQDSDSPDNERAPLEEAVANLNRRIQNTARALEFSIDERYGKPVVSVVDKETEQVIRQIPSDVALQIADALEDATGLLVSEHA